VYADVGGHFLEAAWALVVLHDYLHGRGLGDALIMQSPFDIVSMENVAPFQKAVQQRGWHRADFSVFSRQQGTKQGAYQFSIESVLGLDP